MSVTNDMHENGAPVEFKPTTASDIEAFKHKHPFDIRAESVIAESDDWHIVRKFTAFETFTFTAPDTGTVIFNVRGIKDALAADALEFSMCESALTTALVEHVRANNGVEVEHMARLTAADLERPGILVLWPDGNSTVIDGNNRLVRRWDDGLRTFRFAFVPISQQHMARFMCRPGNEGSFLERRNHGR
jgi:hypothetical protein